MQPVQIILLVMIAVGIIFIVASIILSVREKNSDPDISARKQELKEEMERMYEAHARTAQEQLDEATKRALEEYVGEARRELEVLINEAREHIEQLSARTKTQMEACVTQAQEETNGIAEEMEARLKELSAEEDEKIRQSFADVRGEIEEHQKETSMAYAMLSEKQNQLIDSIEQEQSKTEALTETVARISADASFLQEELLPAAREAVPGIERTQPEIGRTETRNAEAEEAAETKEAVKFGAVGAEEAAETEEAADIEAAEAEETVEFEAIGAEEAAETEEAADIEATGAEEAADFGAVDIEEAVNAEEAVDAGETAGSEVEAAEAGQDEDPAAGLTEAEQLRAELDFSDTMEFDVVQPGKPARESENLQMTKPIDRGEIREALQAQESQKTETLPDEGIQTVEDPAAVKNTARGSEEIDIDKVVVADVEEFDSIATETVKAAVQEVLGKEESLLDYSETEWDTEAAPEDTEREEMTGVSQAEADETTETAADETAETEADETAETEADEAAETEADEAAETEEADKRHHGKKTSVVWHLSKKERLSEPEESGKPEEQAIPEEETIPEDMVLEDEPNKMLHAVRSSGTVSTEADLEMRKRVLNMYDRGSSSMEIAEKLGLGIGEVRMIVDLYSRRER